VDLARLTSGVGKDLDIHAHTVQRVCPADRIGHKSLGWVPFNTGHVTFDGETFTFRGVRYETMHLRDLLKPGIKICAGSFNQDACGRWYINLPIEVECADQAPNARVGIDLGLKTLSAPISRR
jgi:putative transposase